MAGTKQPSDVAAKWAKNLAGSTSSITAGVNAVTESPTAKAARRIDAQVAGVQAAALSGKTARGLNRVTLQQWQQAMLSKGVPRVASGASAATGKFQDFMTQWLPYEQQLQQKLAAMPRGDLSTNIARAVAAIEHNAAFRRTS